ncbi:hypothetical protein Pelo_16462 [Pelomyxa schiedti]|nr:hypothetical protein Pelo_16459 [Pelomyxa schiedti]KAH3732710.1 hypothetical protein Pelo_16462 [Pelomyxa schiedti]
MCNSCTNFCRLVALAAKKLIAVADGSAELALGFCATSGSRRVTEWLLTHFPEDTTSIVKHSRGFMIMHFSCMNGWMDNVKWAASKFPVSCDELADTFVYSCQEGQLEVCKFLVEKYGFTADHVLRGNRPPVETILMYGHLDMFQWLVSTYGLTRDNSEISKHFGSLLRQVLGHGNPEFAEWFFTQFAVDQTDILENKMEINYRLMAAGSVEMVKWFTAKFEFTWIPHQYVMEIAETSHLDFVEWLCDTFPSTSKYILNPACKQGHIDSVKFICEKISLDASTVWPSLLVSLKEGFLGIAKYLETKYGPFDPTYPGLPDTLQCICSSGNIDTLKWVTTKYPLVMRVEPSVLLPHVAKPAQKNPIPFLQWLFEDRNLAVSSLHYAQNEVFRTFCVQGYLDVLKWFLAKGYITACDLQLTADDSENGPCTPLEIYTINGNMAVVKWISVNYPEIAQSQAVACIRRACAADHTSIARFLLSRYSPTVQELCRHPPCIMELTEHPFILQLLRRLVVAHTHDWWDLT